MPPAKLDSVKVFCSAFDEEFTLLQIFLFALWTLCILVKKCADVAAASLRRSFLTSLGADGLDDQAGEAPDGAASGPSAGQESPSSVLITDLPSRGCLIPALPDNIVRGRVWEALMKQPSIPLLLQLRRVSTAWNDFVISTVEWNAWTFVRLDSLGYCRHIAARQLLYRPVSLRFGSELDNYRFLVSESMEEMACRVRFFRLRNESFPSYIFPEGCPPDVNSCPDYYGL